MPYDSNPPLRDRLLAAAAELTCDRGWDGVTMGQVAARAGVSRQSVYNELGGKPALAEALIIQQTDRFLVGVAEQLSAHRDDVLLAFTAAAEFTLRAAADDPLLKAILASAHGEANDLLPMLTTRPQPVLARAVDAILTQLRAEFVVRMPDDQLEIAVDALVRLTLSHLVQPELPIERATAELRFIASRLLAS
ncbi:TetR/AcrR family transcriptional regulator [Fodinicola feengrottensis]